MEDFADDMINSNLEDSKKISYCLRWNNHRNNLLSSFSELLHKKEFIDVTLACDNGELKCHRMVLAASSTYFAALFQTMPSNHLIVILKDVNVIDIQAILEYMYNGEVNVSSERLPILLRLANSLKVKGLAEDVFTEKREPENTNEASSKQDEESTRAQVRQEHSTMEQSPPSITTSTSNLQSAQSTNSDPSPPHSSACINDSPTYHRSPYNIYNKSPIHDRNSRMNLQLPWSLPSMPIPPPAPQCAMAAMLNNCYDSSPVDKRNSTEVKKEPISRDTPILRTVLGKGQVDTSQPVPLVCHADSRNGPSWFNNGFDKFFKHPAMQEGLKGPQKQDENDDAQSYTDEMPLNLDDKQKLAHLLPPNAADRRVALSSSALANYVPSSKPEWKRYKQYTRNEIMSAIEAVRTGMSALQASKKFGVPSRTLYDKVKKLGITTSRPSKRSSNGSPLSMSPGMRQYKHDDFKDDDHMRSRSPPSQGYYGHYNLKPDETGLVHHAASLMEAKYLQRAYEYQRNNGMSSASSVSMDMRSPSPGALQYLRQETFERSPTDMEVNHHIRIPRSENDTNDHSDRDDDNDDMDDDNQVEDLSVARKNPPLIDSCSMSPRQSHRGSSPSMHSPPRIRAISPTSLRSSSPMQSQRSTSRDSSQARVIMSPQNSPSNGLNLKKDEAVDILERN